MKNSKNFIIYVISFVILTLSLSSQNSFEQNVFTAEDTVKSLKFLSARISQAIISANLKNTNYALAVYSLDNHQFYFKNNTSEPLIPASLTKLFTAFTALKKLGTNFVYRTGIYYTGQNRNGIITGDIYIVGNGDPEFCTDDLHKIVDSIKAMGIKKINGNIIADDSFFDNITDRVKYSGDKDRVQALQKITGLSINKNIVTVTIKAIPQDAQRRAQIITDPPSPSFRIINKTKVKGSLKRQTKSRTEILQKSELNTFGGPVENMNTSRRSKTYIKEIKTDSGEQIFTATGTFNAGETDSYSYFILQPELAVAGALLRIFNQSGIKVSGTFKTGKLKDAVSPIYKLVERKRKIVNVISPMLKNSDNYLAENVFKLIGAHSGKMVENSKESQQIIINLMDSLNIDFDNCKLYDGSGLSRRNKITAETGIELLNVIYKNNDVKTIIDTSLSIAGTDGTLKNRMRYTLAEGNLKAKTGTHGNVSGLCGVVRTLDGERLAFCFIFNGPSVELYKQVENKLGVILAEFFYFNREG